MKWDAQVILALVGSGLALGGTVKPTWPLIGIGCFLIGVAVFIIANK